MGGETLEVVPAEVARLDDVAAALRGVGQGEPTVDVHTRRVAVAVTTGAAALVDAVRELARAGVQVIDVGLHRLTLDDVFLQLTGHGAEASADEAPAVPGRRRRGRKGAAA